MNTKYFQKRLARLHELANPVEEYRDERIASKRKLKENSQLRKGKVIGAGLGALTGASVIKQSGYGLREIARGAAGPGGRRSAAALIGVPAVAGAAVGGAIGARMRKKKKELSARLHEFVSLVREQRGDCGGLYGCEDHGPTMYVSGVEDPALMAMEKEGVATVRYKIRSRSVNERGDEPTYGADISISSIEPVKSPKKELSVLERVREFADRERNPSGQFISGVSANPDDMAMAYKKKVGKIAGAAVAGTGVAMAATPGGRKVLGRVGQSVMRGAGRVLIR